MAKKVSANFEDKNRIREWAETGASPERISDLVGVEVDYVRAFLGAADPAPEEFGEAYEPEEEEEEVEETEEELDED